MRAIASIGFPNGVEPMSTPFGALIAGGNRLAPTESADETEEHPSKNTKDWRTANPRRKDEVRRESDLY